jgi:cytochrome c5
MRRVLQILSILSAVVAAIGEAAAQPADLPPRPSRELVAHECQACHDLGMVLAAAGQDRAGWSSTIDEMMSYGLRVTPDEQARILEYLATYLGPAAPEPAKQ